jgi:hypothetical protein
VNMLQPPWRRRQEGWFEVSSGPLHFTPIPSRSQPHFCNLRQNG